MVRLVTLALEPRVKVVLVELTETWTAPKSCGVAVLSVYVWDAPLAKMTVPAPLVTVVLAPTVISPLNVIIEPGMV